MKLQKMGGKRADGTQVTQDFEPMIQIVFWNSLGFLFYNYLIMYVPIQVFHTTGAEMGFIFSLQAFGRLFSTPLIAYLTDRVPKKRLVLVGALGRCLAYAFYFISIVMGSLKLFGLGVFLQGVLVGFFWPPLNALIAQKSEKTYRSTAYGRRSGMIGKGGVVGSLISFPIYTLANKLMPENLLLVYSPLVLFAFINILAGIYFYKHVNETIYFSPLDDETELPNGAFHPQRENGTHNQQNLNGKQYFIFAFFMLTLAMMTSSLNDSINEPFLQAFLIAKIISDAAIVMFIFFFAQILSLLFAPLLGRVCDRINPKWGISILSVIGGTLTFILINAKTAWLFALVLAVDLTFARSNILLMENVLSRISVNHRGKIFGIAEWMKLVGHFVGPNIGGWAWDKYGPQSPFLISISLELLLIPLYLIALIRLRPFIQEKTHELKT